MKQQVGFKWKARGRARAIPHEAERISYHPHHEIRDQVVHGRGEGQPLSQETLISLGIGTEPPSRSSHDHNTIRSMGQSPQRAPER